MDIVVHNAPVAPLLKLQQAWKNPTSFEQLSFGQDVSEQDPNLSKYFIATDTYRKAKTGQKSVIIGPKGSGKSAILHALSELPEPDLRWHCIVITPETFATSVLQRFLHDSEATGEEQEAFASAWIFTILFEVFTRVCDKASGSSKKSLKRIEQFLLSHAEYRDCDLFTRFVQRLASIEKIKIGPFEISVKTRELQRLYSLEEVYSLIPDLRSALQEDVLVLIDELDQGWDNTEHSNRFVASLMRAAIRVQSLDLRIRVIAFLRSEIFDIVKDSLDQLDKLRSGIEILRWDRNSLAGVLIRRVAFSMNVTLEDVDLAFINTIFPEAAGGLSGFDYLLSRTTMRPREVLQFARLAHQKACESHSSAITRNALLRAEEEFSYWKVEHLCSEYRAIFPKIGDLLATFRRAGPVMPKAEVASIVQRYLDEAGSTVPTWANVSTADLIQRLYQVEFLGIERMSRSANTNFMANFEFAMDRPTANTRGEETFIIHPAFWYALETPDATGSR